jgi:hypothetical protein
MNASAIATETLYSVVVIEQCSCLASIVLLIFVAAPLVLCLTNHSPRAAPPPVVVEATPAPEKV